MTATLDGTTGPLAPPAPTVLTADDIVRLLPHRYPFFLLDRGVGFPSQPRKR